uniref:Cysteine proteinase inhibitor n=1 Tax=Manduca sexta TaxID=7130 RepID=C4B4C8_MANSE|nr:cysteine proteinase inhibitor precursor [Manduca sexta]BAI44279.1 cysteine proteinase inhibitor precursor [Manduca sexta]
MYTKNIFLFLPILISLTRGEISLDKKDKLLNGFIEFYNNLPNQVYTCEEGSLQNVEDLDDKCYRIEVSLHVSDTHNLDSRKYVKCTARMQELQDEGVKVANDEHHCQDMEQKPVVEEVIVTEAALVRKPVQLDNEVEPNSGVTSGEQFIAVPREEPGAPCIGCATHINPQAAGVTELATLAVRHLDRHDPGVRHALKTVIDVERQVQVVNGVRYILTLLVDYDSCTETQTESCVSSNTCKISILEKPWVKLPRGGKYRGILSNNCTSEWQFGDNGEVIDNYDSNNRENNEVDIHPRNDNNAGDDVITVAHTEDVQAQQNQVKKLTDDQVKKIEEQIIPHSEFHQPGTTEKVYTVEQSEEHAIKDSETTKYNNQNTISQPKQNVHSSLSDERKKTIEELMNFFEFSAFGSERDNEKDTRMKRSLDHDVEAMLLADDFQALHKSIKNGRYLYDLAQTMVDYLNEMDLTVKTRTLKNVVKAEDEIVNYQHFYYIQARIIIPCDKAVCESKDTVKKICNGIIEGTDKKHPHVLTAFCYNEEEGNELNNVSNIPLDDPVLQQLCKESIKKIEKESPKLNALNISEMISATTQKVSGTLTKIAFILEHLNCTKDTPVGLRRKCEVVDELGSNLCEAVIFEKHTRKERQITYNCIERPIDTSYLDQVPKEKNYNDDTKVIEMVQEALQYLEIQSNRNNKQKIVAINSVATQINAGLVTKIEFIVGYTSCSSNTEVDLSICPLLASEPLRKCNAQIWDRTWIEDGRQVEVDCEDVFIIDKNIVTKDRKKRSVPGGITAQNPNAPEFKQLAEESMQKYLQSIGSTKPHKVVRVVKATTQVVSGSMTRIEFVISPSDGNSGDVISCYSEVWEQPWMHKKEITVDCKINNQKYRAKRETPVGGIQAQDPNDPIFQSLAEESMQKYLQSIGSTKPHKVVRVVKATTQVVSGSMTRIEFVISPSDGNSGDVISCYSEVWEQPWRHKKEITVDCKINNQKYRAKRETPVGGIQAQEPNDPIFQSLAEESMQKYLQSIGSTKPHKVVRVVKASTQVVSGSMTRIEFVISPSDRNSGDVISCYSEVWEQPWRHKKEITVDCKINNQKYRAKRETPVGGIQAQDPNDPIFQSLAEESMQKYLQSIGSTKPHKVVRVVKATTQVVSGSMTRIEFVISPSDGNSGDVISCYSEVWEQPWRHKKEITVDCKINNQKYRAKRETPVGGIQAQEPNDPIFQSLAEESMQKYLQSIGSTKPHKVVRVVKASTQVVSGSMTRIEFVISPSDGNSGDVISCYSEVWEQPWRHKKEITVDCKINNQKYRAKRETPVGGIQAQEPNDPIFQSLAEESMQKYLQSIGSTKPHKVVRVVKASTQVVSGSMTRIEFVISPSDGNSGDVISCYSEVWEQPWMHKKEITVDCKINNQKYRAKRETPVGGIQAQDPNDPIFQSLADESMQKYLQSIGSTKPHKVVRVVKATTQVVSGSMTRIEFVISPADGNSGDVISCYSEVWEQPWRHKKEITVDCKINNQKYRAKRETPVGGIQAQEPNDPIFQSLAEESMQKYLQSIGSTKPHKVVRVVKASTQVVSGSMTRIEFVISPSDGNSGDVISCYSEVWEQPWMHKKEITVDCKINNQKYRAKRETPVGGIQAQDPNDPIFQSLAEESMQKYLQSIGSTKPHKVVRVVKATTQVVSGSMTRIEFVISPSDGNSGDVISCYSEVWEQPWMHKKEITVDCKINNQKYRAKRAQPLMNKKVVKVNYETENQESRTKREILSNSDARQNSEKTIVGAFREEQDPTKNQYKLLAKDSLREYQRLKKSNHAHKVIEVKRVRTKVVSGLIYEIHFTAVPTTCPSKIFDASYCKQQQGSAMLSCHSKIWSQPWLKRKQITVACNPDTTLGDNRNKRDVDFGNEMLENEIEVDLKDKREVLDEEEPIDDELKYYYAERAIQHVNQASNTNNLDKLISVHAVDSSVHMGANMVRLYIEIAPTFCLKHADEENLPHCEEMDGMAHRLCIARLWPSPDDELVVQTVSVVCDDDKEFSSVSGLSIPELLRTSIKELEKSPDQKYKLVHLGEPQVIPSLDSNIPVKIEFIVGFTNCTKDVDIDKRPFVCYLDSTKSSKPCTSFIWFVPNSREIYQIDVKCTTPGTRRKRSVSMNLVNATADDMEIQKLVQESLEKLEMSSIHRYKQRVILINSYSTKLTSGKVTTIDFDVGYTSCLKYEWVDDITTCDFLEHLPRRHCVAHVFERLWLQNGKNIEVNCEDDETPLEAHIEFESAEMAMQLAKEALKHIEAKYPHPRKQKVVRIFSLEKQVVAGIHYRLKIEIGLTDCSALSAQTDCKLVKDEGLNKFCRVNVWLRPWTDHPANYRVTCDYHEAATAEVYHHLQAEHLFYEFLSTYKPEYIDDRHQMRQRFEIFKENVRKMHELNTHERGTATYGVTRFADLTYEEFSTKHMGMKASLRDPNQVQFRKAVIPNVTAPDSFDWRDHGAVTGVKDQGSCGSCWAFSVTGNIEGQWKMKTGDLVSLSEQELVDCDKLDQGCNGGLPDNAYRAIEQLGGLESEDDYPYEGSDDKCSFNKTLARVQISGAVNITSNETDMAKWLVKHGPISIGINANAMQFYMGGISHPWRMLCNPSNLDHGVLIVGYGAKDYPLFHKHLPYWIIKNSWGTSWGEQGYYRVYRGDGTCGVNQMASSAVV